MPARPSGSIRRWVDFFARAITSGTLFGGTIRVRPAIDQTATLRAETFFFYRLNDAVKSGPQSGIMVLGV